MVTAQFMSTVKDPRLDGLRLATIIMGLKFLHVKLYPVQDLETCFGFLNVR